MILVKHCWKCDTDYGPEGPLWCRFCRLVLAWVHVDPEKQKQKTRTITNRGMR